MASEFKNKTFLHIDVERSETKRSCRLNNSPLKKNDVGGYYTNGKKIRPIIESFLTGMNSFIIDSKKMKDYFIDIYKELENKELLFKDKLQNLKNHESSLTSNNIEIPNLYMTSYDKKYIKFDNKNKFVGMFRETIYEKVTDMVIENINDIGHIYLILKKNINIDNIAVDNQEAPVNLEIEFKKWISSVKQKQGRHKGEKYSENTIKPYIQVIENVTAICDRSVYEITSLKEYDDFLEEIKKNGLYQRCVEDDNNRVKQSAINVYRDFLEDLESEIVENTDDNGTYLPNGNNQSHFVDDKKRLVIVRQNQQKFSKAVKKIYGNKCLITGITNSDFLVASHIVPWREDKTIRLDPENGICLSLIYDKAFDKFYISFNDKGTVIISSLLDNDPILKSEIEKYLIEGKIYDIQANPKYLKWHRDELFRKIKEYKEIN